VLRITPLQDHVRYLLNHHYSGAKTAHPNVVSTYPHVDVIHLNGSRFVIIPEHVYVEHQIKSEREFGIEAVSD
jgi:hypothetical protein